MSEYIAHERYDGLSMDRQPVLVRYKDKLERRGDVLFHNHKPICIWRSLVAKQHFAINNDGQGLQRGKLTHAIAYAPRGDGSQRFTDEEQELLRSKYKHLLKELDDVILFNDKFFELSLAELKEVAADLNIN